MIISLRTARRLIRAGQARIDGITYQPDTDRSYTVICRLDTQETAHVDIGAGDRRDDQFATAIQ